MRRLSTVNTGEHSTGRPLVVGIGQTLRGDDGIGWKVAERFEKIHPNVASILLAKPLLPEHAEPMSRASVVVLIDAAVGGATLRITDGPVSLINAALFHPITHAASIAEMIAYSEGLFGQAPPIALITIGVRQFELGEEISSEVAALIDPAVDLAYQYIRRFLERHA
jgi:hydrogenase maturation protease